MSAVTVVAYVIAVGIPAFTIYLFVLLDVFGTGKPSTILLCGGWGATGAFLLAWTINNAILDRGVAYETLTGGVAPVIEELLKLAVLVYLIRSPRFRYIVDGAVYGIAVGIGFALSENLFIYLPGAGEAVLGTAISRTLSTSLMHAAASGLVGISLGRLRRATSFQRDILPLVGIGLAIGVHTLYNNLAHQLEGITLLLVAVGIGIGGGIFIAWQINQGLADEKKRFAQSLGLNVGVSAGEREAVQRLGGASIEQIFGELSEFFGSDRIAQMRRLLAIQANIGILQNNLNSDVSDRLREAWEGEIADYRQEIERLRKDLGASVWLFVQSVFPSDDTAMQEVLKEEFAQSDPTLVHTFDMFMRVAELSQTFTSHQLEEMAQRLSKIEIFGNVSLANLENLSRGITVQSFDKGHVLFNEGDEGNEMYLIEEGDIGIYVHDRYGQEKMLRSLGPGNVVGELALLDGQPRSARAQAHSPVRLLMLPRSLFTMFIQSRPQVVMAVLQYLAGKARFTTDSIETSVGWMKRIGQGDYSMLPETPSAVAPSPVAGTAAQEEPMAVETGVTLEPTDISEETPSMIGNIFSKVASVLQQRENVIRARMVTKES